MRASDLLVSGDWLEKRLGDPNLRVVDMRGYVSTKPVEPGVEEAAYRGAREEYLAGHVPGAVYVDWTVDIIDPNDPTPVQIAPPEAFAEAMGSRGVGDDTTVVAVDHSGGQFATRLWWALTYYGHEEVAVLQGGWNRWLKEGRPVEVGEVVAEHRTFTPRVRPELRETAESLLSRLGGDFVLADARDAGQFSGAKRRGPRGGRIPGAISVPRELFFAEDGGFRPVEEVRELLAARGIDGGREVVAYCNGGVAATVALFNMARLGFLRLANYDGSWNEWGANPSLPIE